MTLIAFFAIYVPLLLWRPGLCAVFAFLTLGWHAVVALAKGHVETATTAACCVIIYGGVPVLIAVMNPRPSQFRRG